MSERPLLLSSAKTGVLVPPPRLRLARAAAIGLGLIAILAGGMDVAGRLSRLAAGSASLAAFAPAAALDDPAVAAQLSPATTTPLVPARLMIPALGVSAAVEQVGKKADGSMGTPASFDEVAWYSPGAKPGAPGNAVFAGHVNNALTTAGVFEHLSQLSKGDRIEIADSAGKSLSYEVISVEVYAADARAGSLFAVAGPSRLVLITCDGQWDDATRQFDKRLVVTAALRGS